MTLMKRISIKNDNKGYNDNNNNIDNNDNNDNNDKKYDKKNW